MAKKLPRPVSDYRAARRNAARPKGGLSRKPAPGSIKHLPLPKIRTAKEVWGSFRVPRVDRKVS